MRTPRFLREEFLDRAGLFLDQAHGAALGGDDLFVEVDAEGVAEGGVEVVDFDGALGRVHPVGIRGADDGSAPQAAAGHHAAENASPVIAPAAIVDAGGATEFTQDHHKGFAEFSVRFEVGKEGGEGGIHGGSVAAHRFENVAVVVEAAAIDLDETDSFFDEAAGQEGTATEFGVAVAVDGGLLFLVEFEGF